MMKKYVKLQLILTLILTTTNTNLTFLNEREVLHNIYSSIDNIVTLNTTNVKATFLHKKHPWFVQFYRIPCDSCLYFVLTWKNLVYEIFKIWGESIKFAVMDCTDDYISELCRKLPKVKTYEPILRYFHDAYEKGLPDIGFEMEIGYNVSRLREKLLKIVVREQKQGRAKNFPNLLPYYGSSVVALFKSVPKDCKHIVLIFSENCNAIGPEIVMKLSEFQPFIYTRYVLTDNAYLKKTLKINVIPTTIILNTPSQTYRRYINIGSNITTIQKTIKNFLKTTKYYQSSIFKAPRNEFWKYYEKQVLRGEIRKMRDPMFYIDLETTLRWSFKKDIAAKTLIEKQSYNALLKYTNMVLKYFPLRPSVRTFMTDLEFTIKSSKGRIYGKEILAKFQNAGKTYKNTFKTPEEWLSCDRDEFITEMYTCGLWKLFHYFTVRAAKKNDKRYSKPEEIPSIMQKYAKYFINCDDCSHNAIKSILELNTTYVDSYDSAIIWLWSAHNTVNAKIFEEEGVDVEFPKVQFPSATNCPECRKIDNTWNIKMVLEYLKMIYDFREGKVKVRNATLRHPVSLNKLLSHHVKVVQITHDFIRELLILSVIILVALISALMCKIYFVVR